MARRTTINDTEYTVCFRHGTCEVMYGSGPKAQPRLTEFTKCLILTRRPGHPEVLASVEETVRRHPTDPQNRVVARTVALERACSHFPDRELRKKLFEAAGIRVHRQKH